MKFVKKSWLHILVWLTVFLYLLFAPEFVATIASSGKPLDTDGSIPPESEQISFRVEGVEEAPKGQNLWNLYGWAFLAPQKDIDADSFVREIVLVSEERVYFFPAKSISRNPSGQSYFTERGVDLGTLGFNALILQATIKPGKYRIGIVFRNASDGSAFYWDRPVYYLVRTPNTLRLERK